MFRLEKEFRFEASHQLPHHSGKCARLHGHSWVGRISVEGEELQREGSSVGMLADFGDLKAAVTPLLEDYLDHFHLNETLALENPTSEEVARWVYYRLKPSLPGLVSVIIEETCTSRAEYREGRS